MQRNFDLQTKLQETEPTMTQSNEPKNKIELETRDWMSAFNTSLLTTRANHAKDRSQELARLMQTPEFASLLVAAQHLSDSQGLSKEEATERLIETFRNIDYCWKQIISSRGLQSVID